MSVDVSSLLHFKDTLSSSAASSPSMSSIRLCTYPHCDKKVRSKGLCKAHGGGLRCSVAGCMRSSQGKGYCIRHGGGKRCSIADCNRSSQSNGLCKSHGGGLRCQIPHCNKSSQGGGFCRMHGGGHRCRTPGCDKGAQRNGLCASHGGNRMCQFDGCKKNDRGGGFCAEHGGGRRCSVDDCDRPARKQGMCSNHFPAPVAAVRIPNAVYDADGLNVHASLKKEQTDRVLAEIPQSAFEPYVDVYEQTSNGCFKAEATHFDNNMHAMYQTYEEPPRMELLQQQQAYAPYPEHTMYAQTTVYQLQPLDRYASGGMPENYHHHLHHQDPRGCISHVI
ncbi:hypothetical protein SPRG_07176 [Saprolegnia parasitica CBS 223.65]|uniref:WRKY19-like zinc finger domain-containing protein n=1 Tax=Saprolegnia parasitica (strain CBS 223.65) TaxID=695850 RepID=A0A067CBM2_SAPPC|nr:hypothetical protein SPRG_07176 [Saprolegnia parasitica CBS 223.65]KDO27903.1 hypothetical protein SPRG_07176 [Saprolegnia parasitica CBS 223.65]|eukprot:XP_012201360.1 hypothetical protein SPRG_07176 [Saprolegnia parasitica CBS 223.65]